MVPVHLTLSQLSKIMLESNVSFKPRFNPELSHSTEQLKEIQQEFNSNSQQSEQYNKIIDLEYDVN